MPDRPPTVVALDAATDDVVVGALAGGKLLYEAVIGRGQRRFPRHAEMLLAEVERAAEAAGGWERVDRIGIGIGPGSYTGLRIGVATGRALAQALALKAVPVGTLEALAAGISASASGERPCLAVLDARRDEVFAQLHDPGARLLSAPVVLAPSRLGEWLTEISAKAHAKPAGVPLAGGSGALRFVRELEVAGVEVLPGGDPAHSLAPQRICDLALAAEPARLEAIQPVYLREPDAKRWLDRDRS